MKVMVIDDEPIVCKALRQLIPWEEYGFEWLGTAENGREALDMILKRMPDLILVDCKMPIMDGLQLLEEIRKRNLPVKSVILSGYNEFMYAQQAIKLGASDYLLKPPDLDHLLEVVRRVRKEWETENRIKRQLSEYAPVMRDRFLLGLIRGARISSADFAEKTEYLKLGLRNGPFVLALLQIEDSGKWNDGSYEDQQLMHFAVLNVAEETLADWPAKVLFQEESRRFVILANADGPEQAGSLRGRLQEVIRNGHNTLGFTATAGVSRLYGSLLHEGRQAYEDAKVAIQHKYYTGPGSVIDYADLRLEDVRKPPADPDGVDGEKLRIAMKVCNEGEVEEWLRRFAGFLEEHNVPHDETRILALQCMIHAAGAIRDIHPQLKPGELITAGQIEALFSASTLDELVETMQGYLFHLLSVTRELRKSGNNAIVEKTKAYIHEHYNRNLTLETIAKEVFVSPVYLSFLFKHVESVNLTDYIAHVRIEQAKRLLQTTTRKTYEIARMVGYQDEKYFSRLFKKKVGLTPTEYRSQWAGHASSPQA